MTSQEAVYQITRFLWCCKHTLMCETGGVTLQAQRGETKATDVHISLELKQSARQKNTCSALSWAWSLTAVLSSSASSSSLSLSHSMGWCQLQAKRSCTRPLCSGSIVTAPCQCSDPVSKKAQTDPPRQGTCRLESCNRKDQKLWSVCSTETASFHCM